MGVGDDMRWWNKQPWYDENNQGNWDRNITQQDCLHKGCTDCHGTGTKKNGEVCVHFISCPCPQCTIMV